MRPAARARTAAGFAPRAVQSGDVDGSSVVLWARAEPASAGERLVVDVTTASDTSFARAKRFFGPVAGPERDFTAQVLCDGLPPGEKLRFRAAFGESSRAYTFGATRTAPPPTLDREIRFAWSGDTVGQGFGIDVTRGGLASYRAVHAAEPELFVHAGDLIYADGPLSPEVPLPDGTVWKNLVTPGKSHVAESLQDFRDAFAYPFLCENVRKLAADVPLFAIWDDHEVWNDFWPGQRGTDERYTERDASVLMARASRAMHEHVPFRPSPTLYRSVVWGPGAELFFLDGRSYRSPDGPNDEPEGSAFFGEAQLGWLIDRLTRSRSTWKIVTTDMPIGLVLPHDYGPGGVPRTFDGIGQGDGPPRGREKEIARLLSALRAAGVKNLLFLTADVHYAALHRFDPAHAAHTDFFPFHECIAGPLHAKSFPPKAKDGTFGPEVLFRVEEPETSGSGPWAGRQSFGLVTIARGSHALTVTFVSGTGKVLHEHTIVPSPGG